VSLAVAILAGVIVGVALANNAWRRYSSSLREYVRLLKAQARASERFVETAEDMAEQWKKVAFRAQAEVEAERHQREVAERRLTLYRDNMHREHDS
jgi:hypothetical protein